MSVTTHQEPGSPPGGHDRDVLDGVADVLVESFGYGHAPAPLADLTIDARRRLRNPAADPALLRLTGLDRAVRSHVLGTPGALAVIQYAAAMVGAVLAHTSTGQRFVLAVGCAGGRHRSVALAEEIAELLRLDGIAVAVDHRDIDKPLLPPGVR